jgi:hypothetical protein
LSAIVVRRGVVLSRFFGVVRRMQMMSVRQMRVVRSLLVRARAMVLGRVAMVLRRLLVMLGGLFVMFRELVLVHVESPAAGRTVDAEILRRAR